MRRVESDRARTLVVASILVGLATLPTRGQAAPSSSAGEPVTAESKGASGRSQGLRITVASSIDDAGLLPGWILERNPEIDTKVKLPGHEQSLEVAIEGETYAYEVTVTPLRDGSVVGGSPERVRCECSSRELLDLVDRELRDAVGTLRREPIVEERSELEPEDEQETEPESEDMKEPPAEGGPSRSGVRPTALGGTGIAVGLVGVAALAAGCSMIVAEPKPLGPHDAVLERDRHPPAVPLLAAGGAALLGGVTMVVLDITRCRRNAAARGCDSRDLETVPPATSRRPRVRLNVSSRYAGVVVQGRF